MAQKAKNNLGELNDILFSQLRKLAAAQDKDEIKQEIERSNAICSASAQVVSASSLALRAACIADQVKMPDMLAIENNQAIDYGKVNG